MWFDDWSDMWQIFATTIIIYAALILILRGVGKRSLAKLNIFDLVVTVALGSTLATIMLSQDTTLAEGALAFVTLCGLQWLVAWLSLRVTWFKKFIRSEPRLLFSDGKFLDRAMREERILRQEVDAEIRSHGFADLEDIAAVVLETDGSFSVIATTSANTRSAMQSVKRDPIDPVGDTTPAR
ncbi:MAG: YetF domain-containing protein [Alteraurantiacibacter sp.]